MKKRLEEWREYLAQGGDRHVMWVGMDGAERVPVRISRVVRAGVRVRWPDGSFGVVHPEDLRA